MEYCEAAVEYSESAIDSDPAIGHLFIPSTAYKDLWNLSNSELRVVGLFSATANIEQNK